MSGFVFVAHLAGEPVEHALIEGLTARLAYRGPDGCGLRVEKGVGMGHTLHRTTDEDRYGSQPCSLDGTTWIVANARIDARKELTEQLGLSGDISLECTPDAELILRAYQKWGADCASHLLGDFAFAIWDAPKRRLLCARDRFGVRQLYYAHRGDLLIVANSLYCLLGHPAISRRLDEEAIGGFLLFGDHTWHDKGLTAFADVRALSPAHCLIVEGGRSRRFRYWDFPLDIPLLRYRREAEYIEHFRHVLGQAVADRLRTDAVVIAMSGGMDSSSLAAMVRNRQAHSEQPVRHTAVSVVYQRVHPSDERQFAGLAAAHLGLPIDFIEADQYPLLDPPIATTRPVELYNPAVWIAMYRKAAEQAQVIFEGEGGDTLLHYSSGPGTLRGLGPMRILLDLARLTWRYRRPPGMGTGLWARWQRLAGRRPGAPQAPIPYPEWLNPAFEERLGLRQAWQESWTWQPSPCNARHPAIHAGLVLPDWNTDELYLNPGFTLPEIRDPYIDLRLLELILALPPLPWLFSKHVLRLAMADDLPRAILRRPKTGLGNIHQSLLERPDARWVDAWKPLRELASYTDWSKIPPLDRVGGDALASYVNLRPLLLDHWLRTLRETLAAHNPLQSRPSAGA